MSAKDPERPLTHDQRQLKRTKFELKLLVRLLPSEQQMLFIWAGIVGFLGACAAVLFKMMTEVIQWVFTGEAKGFVHTFTELDPAFRFVIPVAGALFAGLLLTWTANSFRSRRTDYMEAVALGDGHIPVRHTLLRSLAAFCSISSGASIGREGPLVQLAALMSSLTARARRMSPARRRMLVACGAAAGIGAAYHTPLAGALFVAEIVLGSMAMTNLGPLLISSVTAALTVRILDGGAALYIYKDFVTGDPREILLFAIIGILCGATASLWMRLLKFSKASFSQLPVPIWVRLTLGGVIVGAIALFYPQITGNGAGLIRQVLEPGISWEFVALLLLFKVVASAAAFGSGAVGGVFTPSLTVGTTIGFLVATVISLIWPWSTLDLGGYALVGMGSFLAAATQAPITAILMCFEMTLQYGLILPLMVAVVAAHATSQKFGGEGLYSESLLDAPKGVFDRPLGSVAVADIMRPATASITPTTSFEKIARAFLSSGNRTLWIVDDAFKYQGEIFLGTVAEFLKDPLMPSTIIAADIMQEDLKRLSPALTLPAALDIFAKTREEDLPVINPDSGELVGAITKSDLLIAISELTRRESIRG